ncbi:MAG: MBL fold metallo-hydrolase [Anaerolineales bacterium]|nr:MBL fold metallo-hydrolase [Anaerolineales bacterium]
MTNELRVKFWGVRGSYPTPGAGTIKYGGNTASVEIRAGERTIILDAGTGIIPLGRELARTKRAGKLALLLSHLHHDHTQGFPFFVPAYLPNTKLHVFGPDGTHESMKNVLERNQSSETFPVSLRDMAAVKDIQTALESQVIVWDGEKVEAAESARNASPDAVVIHIHKSYAHPGGVYVYRIEWRGKSVVYATDTEGYVGGDKKLARFAKGADVLIHDAQYLDEHYWGALDGFPSTQGFGHSTVSMACEVAASSSTGQLVLFHHDPSYTDDMLAGMERTAKSLFADSTSAYEGLEIALQLQMPSPLPLSHGERGAEAVQYAHNG